METASAWALALLERAWKVLGTASSGIHSWQQEPGKERGVLGEEDLRTELRQVTGTLQIKDHKMEDLPEENRRRLEELPEENRRRLEELPEENRHLLEERNKQC